MKEKAMANIKGSFIQFISQSWFIFEGLNKLLVCVHGNERVCLTVLSVTRWCIFW